MTLQKNNILSNPQLQKLPYKTPDGYFDSFYQNLSKQLPANANKKRTLRPYILWAAAALLLLLISLPIFTQINTQNNTEEYEIYLYSQLDQNTYYELLSSNY
jgi:hypothetical protein